MSGMILAVKTCATCGQEKPLSQFYRALRNRDGHRHECKDCVRAYVDANKARRRAEMGEAGWLAHQRNITAKSRAKAEVRDRDRLTSAAYHAASGVLRENHRDEFDALLARERYERGLT